MEVGSLCEQVTGRTSGLAGEQAWEAVGVDEDEVAGAEGELIGFHADGGVVGFWHEFRNGVIGRENQHAGVGAAAGHLENAARWVQQEESQAGAAGVTAQAGAEGALEAGENLLDVGVVGGFVAQKSFGQGDGEGGGETVVAAFGYDHAEAPIGEGEEIVEVTADIAGRRAGGGDAEAGDLRRTLGQEAQLRLAGGVDLSLKRAALDDVAGMGGADLVVFVAASAPGCDGQGEDRDGDEG